MQMPSTRNFTIVPFQMPDEWAQRDKPSLFDHLEQWAAEHLKPREAAIGNYTFPFSTISRREALVLGQIWILRHNDYDTGRANIEIQTREIRGENTRVCQMRDDRMEEATILTHRTDAEYCRVVEGDKLTWLETSRLRYEHRSLIDGPPAVRVPELLRQCWSMGKVLSEWLGDNTVVIPKDADEPVNIRPATTAYMRHNLLFYAMDEAAHQRAKDTLNNPDCTTTADFRRRREGGVSYQRLLTDLQRSDRIAGPEHYALYERLKDSVRYIRDQPHPSTRPIHMVQLLGTQTRWINEFRELLKPFLKR